MKIKCNMCGSTNVEEHVEIPEDTRVMTMSEYERHRQHPFMTLEMRYNEHTLTCKDCGYKFTFWC